MMGTPLADMMYPEYMGPRPITLLSTLSSYETNQTLLLTHSPRISFHFYLASKRYFWRTHWNEIFFSFVSIVIIITAQRWKGGKAKYGLMLSSWICIAMAR